MSGESQQDRTEKPTPRKRREARKKGKVPRSREVTTAFLLLAGGGVIAVGGASLSRTVGRVFREATMAMTALPVGPDASARWLASLVRITLLGIAPVIALLTLVALLTAGAQGQGVLTTEPLKPQWERLAPWKNIPRIWGWKALAELGKSLLKFGVLLLGLGVVAAGLRDPVILLIQQPLTQVVELVRDGAARILFTAGATYLLVAAADYAFELWRHERSLRMTRQQVKRERKDTEGDPNVKARRRSMGQALARRRMILAVSEADVVVTNPVHVAVALRYQPEKAPAPVVLAMGERKLARRIRKQARDAGVPIVENPPVARALFRSCEPGSPIPAELYVAVAEILAYVFRTHPGRRGRNARVRQ